MFKFILSLLSLSILFFASYASAQGVVAPDQQNLNDVVIVPAGPSAIDLGLPLTKSTDNVSHADLIITPDRSEIIRLDKDAASVIIGNPQHLNVLAENPRTLVLVPRMSGATHITILDQSSNVIMQRHVIVGAVSSDEKKYIRIRKSCAAGNNDCQETQTYYCPGMCHEIGASSGGEGGAQPASDAMSSGGNTQNSGAPPPPPPAVDATEG